ncbi:flagellar hook-associated protein 3 FlgL [Amphritea atlantica]|uniref:Flagellar hook-associated protein 3 FlgL n=1 Tax=Amphritea atlantica TaxID=355243 RepID=A0A1H9L9E8_9GAMM|nr:flagellar hook-associated protein FlgL [Amphritea atlantica]SER08024.1 flagellar hook-associated protein 3 FlgL [Amphritea atlantica]
MRISTAQIFSRNTDNINNANSSLFKTQQQLSTGKRILQPSDDPVATAQLIKLDKEISKTDKFQDNIVVSRRRLNLEETTLDAVNNATQRIKELAIQANSGAVNDNDRTLIASELKELESQLFGLLNTQDTQGEYLFSGYKGFDAAYRYDGATDSYVFNGDEGSRSIQVGPNANIVSTDSGFNIFENVPSQLALVPATGNEFSGRIITDFGTFGEFTDSRGPATVTFDTVAGTYSVTDAQGDPVFGGNPAAELTDISYQQGDTIEFEGLSLVIDSPADGAVVIETETQRTNVLNMVHQLNAALTSINTVGDPQGTERLNEAVNRALLQIDSIESKNIQVRGSIGARMNTLDAQESVNEEYKLYTNEAQSSLQDLDYNDAISRFTLQQTTLNAAYASFAKIQNLSLFNYIN